MPMRILLGPQRPTTNLGDAVAMANLGDGPVAVISAGWQEAEGDIDDIAALVKRPLRDLRLYHRAEEVFATDERLRLAYRERQERLQELQRLYQARLRQLMIAARAMLRAEGDGDLLAAEQRHALSQLRALDRHHLGRVQTLYETYRDSIGVGASPLLAEHSAAIDKVLDECETLVITGGNVVVLLNRLRLFGMQPPLLAKNVIAWSAGAMVLGKQIVLYHDKTAHGRRDPEVLDLGAGAIGDHILLPDAARRLRRKESLRMGLFCRRFAPATCVTLDSGALLRFENDTLTAAVEARRLTRGGGLVPVQAT